MPELWLTAGTPIIRRAGFARTVSEEQQPMPLDATPDATPDGLYGTDVTALDDLARAYIIQDEDIRDAEETHSEMSKYLFDAWLRVGELIWTAKNVADIPVSTFRKAIEERGGKPLDKATAYNLIAFYENRNDIIDKCEKEQAAAERDGNRYIWPGWYSQLAKVLGRKGRDEFPTDAGTLAKKLIVDELQSQLTTSEERAQAAEKQAQAAEQKAAELQTKLDKQFRGRMAREVGSDNRPTVQYVFDFLNKIHDFDWDCCASKLNTKVPKRFFSVLKDALKREWRFRCGYCNPPYRAKMIRAFLMKAIAELRAGHCEKVVFLLPAWTDARWFSELVGHGHIEFIRGRLSFLNGETGNVMDGSPWASMIVTVTKESMRDGNKLSASIIAIPRPKNYLSGTRKTKKKPVPERSL